MGCFSTVCFGVLRRGAERVSRGDSFATTGEDVRDRDGDETAGCERRDEAWRENEDAAKTRLTILYSVDD